MKTYRIETKDNRMFFAKSKEDMSYIVDEDLEFMIFDDFAIRTKLVNWVAEEVELCK